MFNIFTKAGFIEFLYFLPALLLSLSIHEFGHALVAYKLGDKSQKAFGRLTIAPFAHIDWTGFLSIMLFGFGWGKPVMVDDRSFKKHDRDVMFVALAGPMFNIMLAILLAIVLKLLYIFGISFLTIKSTMGQTLYSMLITTIQFNVIFSAFNLIPLPPFDGFKVLRFILPYKIKIYADKLEKYALLIIILLVTTQVYVYFMNPIASLVTWIISLILTI